MQTTPSPGGIQRYMSADTSLIDGSSNSPKAMSTQAGVGKQKPAIEATRETYPSGQPSNRPRSMGGNPVGSLKTHKGLKEAPIGEV